MWLTAIESTLNAIRCNPSFNAFIWVIFSALTGECYYLQIELLHNSLQSFLIITIPRDRNKVTTFYIHSWDGPYEYPSIAIRICRSGSTRSKRCCQYIYVAFGKRKAARISVSLNSLRRLLMILAVLSFFERPRGAISSILLNRHSLFEHSVICFSNSKIRACSGVNSFSSFGYVI